MSAPDERADGWTSSAAARPGTTIGVAIAVPTPWGEELQECRRELGDPHADAIPTHVTLLPPTTVDDSLMPEVIAHLDAVAAVEAPFAMELRGCGTFRPVSPVVFVTVATGIGGCERIQKGVRSGPLERELHYPYHPHVTVAHDVADDILDRAYESVADYRAAFTVNSFHIYEHGDDGVWRSRREFKLGG
jgi:2'-5' RNA ligase